MLTQADRAAFHAGATDDPIAVDTHYIQSNETRHDLFFSYIDGIGGAYIGVGSDQNFTLMGRAQSEYAFLVDIDTRVVDLHAIYEVFIGACDTPAELVAKFEAGQGEASLAELDAALSDHPNHRRIVGGFRSGRETVYRHLQRVIGREREGKPTSWLSDPEVYAHVKAMFATGRVRAMVGNLAGGASMKTAAAAAEALHTPVRVYYPSNAEEYFRYDKNYRENIRALPVDGKSVIVRTIYRKEWEHADLWAYQVQPIADLQERLTVQRNRSRKSMLKFAEADGHVERDLGIEGFSRVGFTASKR
jgi:hypothetical protein